MNAYRSITDDWSQESAIVEFQCMKFFDLRSEKQRGPDYFKQALQTTEDDLKSIEVPQLQSKNSYLERYKQMQSKIQKSVLPRQYDFESDINQLQEFKKNSLSSFDMRRSCDDRHARNFQSVSQPDISTQEQSRRYFVDNPLVSLALKSKRHADKVKDPKRDTYSMFKKKRTKVYRSNDSLVNLASHSKLSQKPEASEPQVDSLPVIRCESQESVVAVPKQIQPSSTEGSLPNPQAKIIMRQLLFDPQQLNAKHIREQDILRNKLRKDLHINISASIPRVQQSFDFGIEGDPRSKISYEDITLEYKMTTTKRNKSKLEEPSQSVSSKVDDYSLVQQPHRDKMQSQQYFKMKSIFKN